MHESRHARLEHRPVARDAGGAHRGQRDAVIAPLARDDLGFVLASAQLPVGARHLDAAFGRLAAPGGEKETVDRRIGELGQLVPPARSRADSSCRRRPSNKPSVSICAAAASASSLRPWPATTFHSPARPSIYSLPSASIRIAPSPLTQTCAERGVLRLCSGWIRWSRSRATISGLVDVAMNSLFYLDSASPPIPEIPYRSEAPLRAHGGEPGLRGFPGRGGRRPARQLRPAPGAGPCPQLGAGLRYIIGRTRPEPKQEQPPAPRLESAASGRSSARARRRETRARRSPPAASSIHTFRP